MGGELKKTTKNSGSWVMAYKDIKKLNISMELNFF